MRYYRPAVAEFIGTFALIFVGVGSIAETAASFGQSPNLVAVALAHGLTIAVMASATGAISGGHLNPAVSIGAFVAGKLDALGLGVYVVAQCLGGLAGAICINLILPAAHLSKVGGGVPAPGNGISGVDALFLEVVLTFFLMFVIYGTAMSANAPKVGALFIGLTVTLDILIGGPVTGAAMNPARWLGPALLLPSHLVDAWIYWIGPGAGAILAGLVWRYVLEEPVRSLEPNEGERTPA